MTKEERDWIDVILKTDSNLYLSNSLQKRTSSQDKKRQRVFDYLNKIEEYSLKCLGKRGTSFERHYKQIFYYSNYIIREEDIHDSYFEHQLDLRRQLGFEVRDFTDEERHKLALEAISDQRVFLDEWINYFVYGNGRFYPIYEKYWVFQGLQKLGKYDSETGVFSTRNKNTVYPFPSIDEAALEMTITLMENFIKTHEIIPGLEGAFNSYNFKTLYEYSLKEVAKERKFCSSEGIWKKYEMGSDPDVVLSDIRGKHTGWCIERSSWVQKYLSESDFYIFFTKDVYGNYSNPRLTIRVCGNEVVEVRGISAHQNIEGEMLDVATEKLEEFSFSDDYFIKEKNMKLVTLIEKKVDDDIPLDIEELRFIYEIDTPIVGFGGQRDPRVREIIKKRNIKKDLSIIYGVAVSEVATCLSELNKNIKVYYGNLDMIFKGDTVSVGDDYDDYIFSSDDIVVPENVVGDIFLNGNYDRFPKTVSGSFQAVCPETMDKLELPSHVSIHVSIQGLKEASEIILPKNVCYDITFYDLMSASNIVFPPKIFGSINLGDLFYAEGFVFPQIVKGNVNLPVLINAKSCNLPSVIGGNLNILNLRNMDEVVMPEMVIGKIICNNFSFKKNAEGRMIK